MTISGKYRIFEDGVLVSEVDNLLTTAGKRELLGMIAGTSPRISRIGLGVGATTPNVADTTLSMPLITVPVDFTIPLFGSPTSKVVYKSRVDEGVSGVIWEIGCFNSELSENQLVLNWRDDPADVTGPAGGGANDVRVGPTSPLLTHPATLTISQPTSLGTLKSTDRLALAFKPTNTTVININLTITDINGLTATRVYAVAASANYQIVSHPLSAFTIPVAGFDWSQIASFSASLSATGNPIILDGLAALAPTQTGVLLSHATYGAGVTKRHGVRMDIEYELTFTL